MRGDYYEYINNPNMKWDESTKTGYTRKLKCFCFIYLKNFPT